MPRLRIIRTGCQGNLILQTGLIVEQRHTLGAGDMAVEKLTKFGVAWSEGSVHTKLLDTNNREGGGQRGKYCSGSMALVSKFFSTFQTLERCDDLEQEEPRVGRFLWKEE